MSNKCGDGVVGGKGGGGIQQPSGQTNRVPPLSNPGTLSIAFSEFELFETNLFISLSFALDTQSMSLLNKKINKMCRSV